MGIFQSGLHNKSMSDQLQPIDPLLKQILQCVQATLLRIGLMEDHAPGEEAFKKHLTAIYKAMIEASTLLEQASKAKKV
jgi:hypothetical protein